MIDRPAPLLDRDSERRVLDELISSISGGTSKTVVIVGDVGVGKTTLIETMVQTAGITVARTVGAESEQLLDYAGLHRLVLPFLDRASRLAGPQRDALLTAFGMVSGPPPQRFHLGLAVLSLLADVAVERPLLIVVDDAHWFDQESLEVVAFVARRLDADAIGLVLSFRTPAVLPALERTTVLLIEGLPEPDAARWLEAQRPGPVHDDVARRIIDETAGNPLAMREVVDTLTADQLAGRRPLPATLPVGDRLRQSFAAQVDTLPEATRALLLLMSIAPTNDPAVLWRAAAALGVPAVAADPAVVHGILVSDPTLRFRHPLIRSAVYSGAPPADRRLAHAALAAATDRAAELDRWVWHRAAAVVGTDEEVAVDLDLAAERGRTRGGDSARAALLLRAAELSTDPAGRARRLLGSGEAQLRAGDLRSAQLRLRAARPGLLEPLSQATATRALAFVEFSLGNLDVVPPMLLEAAEQAAGVDTTLSRVALFEALISAIMGRHRQVGWTLPDVAATVLESMCPGNDAVLPEVMAAALATRLTSGYEAAVPLMKAAAAALDLDILPDTHLSWAIPGSFVTLELWDDSARDRLLHRLAGHERETGDLRSLHITLRRLVRCYLWRGDFATAAQHHAEASDICLAIGSPDYGFAMRGELIAWQGKESELRALAGRVLDGQDAVRNSGYDDLVSHAMILLELSLGRYDEALTLALPLFADDAAPIANSIMPDLIEAAVRVGDRELAVSVLDRLASRASMAGTPWALGVLARSRALLADADDAAELYAQALLHLGTTLQRTEVARTHLLFGQWLRRRRRPADATAQLRAAHEMFTSFGAPIFAERAAAELRAVGGRVPRRAAGRQESLTPQEHQVATMAAARLTNGEIAGRLYLTTSTVEYHLTKVFRKLGVTSRRQLGEALGRSDSPMGD